MSNTTPAPRSVRLNQAHRRDITDSIMEEYVKQNPCEVDMEAALKAYSTLFLTKLQKTPAFARTIKVNAEMPALFDHMHKYYDVLVRHVDSKSNPVYSSRKRLNEDNFPGISDYSLKVDSDNDCLLYSKNTPVVDIPEDSPELTALSEAKQAVSKYKKEVAQMREETFDALSQFNTTNQIRESWPEIVPYFPPHIADPNVAITVPVRTVDRLSERLGIK